MMSTLTSSSVLITLSLGKDPFCRYIKEPCGQQAWLGHANVSTTGLYDRRKTRPEDSLTFHVKY